VLDGLVRAEWLQAQERNQAHVVVAMESDPAGAQRLREILGDHPERFVGKVVRDRLGVQLLLRRMHPDALMLAVDTEEQRVLARELRRSNDLKNTRFVGIAGCSGERTPGSDGAETFGLDAILHRPFSDAEALDVLERVLREEGETRPGQSARTDDGSDQADDHTGRSLDRESAGESETPLAEVGTDRDADA
jgi:hypothetical protein